MSEIYTGKIYDMIYTVRTIKETVRKSKLLDSHIDHVLGEWYAQANRSRIDGNPIDRGNNLVFEKKRGILRESDIFVAVRIGHVVFVAERSAAHRGKRRVYQKIPEYRYGLLCCGNE